MWYCFSRIFLGCRILLTSSHHCAVLSSPTRPSPQFCLLQEKGDYEDSLLKERDWAQLWNNSDKQLTLEHWPPGTHILPRQTRKRKTLMTRSISYFVTVLRRKQSGRTVVEMKYSTEYCNVFHCRGPWRSSSAQVFWAQDLRSWLDLRWTKGKGRE